MIEPRQPLDEEHKALIEFLSKQLRPNATWSIAEEYPLALARTNSHNIRVIRDGDNFLSAAVMKPMIVKTLAGLFKVGAIGSVVTEPSQRNRGLSHRIMEECLKAGKDQGCDFAILWTDLYDFYRKLDFELAGKEVSVVLTQGLPSPSQNLRFEQTAKIDPESILRLYSKHTCGVVRTADDIRKSLRIPNTEVYSAWSADGKLKAFAVEGKGADLKGYIHEWAGDVDDLVSLLAFAQTKNSEALTVLCPAHAHNIIQRLGSLGGQKFEGVLGMIKILNPVSFMAKVKKYFRSLGIEGLVFEYRDDQYYIGYGSDLFKTDSGSDVVRLVFGPQKASELYPFEGEMKEVFENALPLPLWIWGWDSV